MRIAQVSPLLESVPPRLYGGTERVVSYLTEELVRQGHEVTLFASGDSVTEARLIPVCARALRLDKECVDQLAYHILMLEKVIQQSDEFDVIHNHIDYLHYPFSRRMQVPHVTTLHGRLDIRDLVPLYQEFSEIPVVSISEAQRKPLPFAHWVGTVYHGLPVAMYEPVPRAGGYLLFLGRISPEKRLDRAIEIARRFRMPLKIAAKIDPANIDYYERVIRPMLDDPLVEFLGEVGQERKVELLRGAFALLFPIDWAEPFGLVMIEAMACGAPVVAFRRGSVPEVIEHGLTGYIVESEDEAVAALRRVPELDRGAIRREFEARFSAERMTRDYLEIYRKLQELKIPVERSYSG